MAKQTLPPFFEGTAQFLTFYKMNGRHYVRMKSSLTAERVKTDACFAPTMYQAGIMAHAAQIGSAAYNTIPEFCREYKHYRMLTGKANRLLKQGLHEDEIIVRLIEKYIVSIRRQAIKKDRRKMNKAKRTRTRHLRPPYLGGHRRLKMVQWGIQPGMAAAIPADAIDSMLNAVLENWKILCTAGDSQALRSADIW